jgi:amino acid transporter
MDEDNEDESGLQRLLTPLSLSLYGLGTILGAGIYVVIGKIAGEAGLLAPASFLFAAVAAASTALSYVELATRIPLTGGSAAYVDHAFEKRALTAVVGWGMIATGLVSAATIITGFYGYLSVFVDSSRWLVVPVCVTLLTGVATIGIKQSAWFMGLTTLAGLTGLAIVLIAAGGNLASYPSQLSGMGTVNFTGVFLGGFLAFYAYVGFEDVVTLSEETQDITRTLPIAIFVALGASALLYTLVAAVAVSTLSAAELNESMAPLVDVVRAAGHTGTTLGALSLAIIINGALAQIVMSARVTHDLGERRGLVPSWLARIDGRTKTPLIATSIAGATVLLLALFFPTETLARATSFIVLGVFVAINAALIRLKWSGQKPDHSFKQYSLVVPIFGLLISLLLLTGEIMLSSPS